VVPNIPGLAKAVNPSLRLNYGIEHIYDMNYLWGFSSAAVVCVGLNYAFPAKETLIDAPIYEDISIIDGVEYKNDGVHTPTTAMEGDYDVEQVKDGSLRAKEI
jgi:NCS1 family nucleobase:cation symporter-1